MSRKSMLEHVLGAFDDYAPWWVIPALVIIFFVCRWLWRSVFLDW